MNNNSKNKLPILYNNKNIFDNTKDESFIINKTNIKLKIFTLNHYFFRGDSHINDINKDYKLKNNNIITDAPKFYGTLSSSYKYASPILKFYKVLKPLKLLSFDFTPNNAIEIYNLFNNMIKLKQFNKNDIYNIKFLYILIQINFGLIVPEKNKDDTYNMPLLYNLNKMGFTNKEIAKFISNNCDTKGNETSSFIYYLLNNIELNKSFILNKNYFFMRYLFASRSSLRVIDKYIVKEFYKYSYLLNIDGIVITDNYIKYHSENKNLICKYINAFNAINNSESCIPTEFCIFNPKQNLKLLDFATKYENPTRFILDNNNSLFKDVINILLKKKK
jgi:hypothetical protein